MAETSGARGLSPSYRKKKAVVSTALLALGVAIDIVSRHSPELKKEIADWEDGRVFSLGVLPDGPAISLRKEADRIRYLGKGYKDPKLRFLFKNIDCALLQVTGKMGAHTAYAQHRAILHGNLVEGVQTSRALSIVQTYLSPGVALKKTMKRPPKLTPAQLLIKVRVMATLPVAMLLYSRK